VSPGRERGFEVGSGRITPRIEQFTLDEIDDVYRRMREGTLEARAVVTPNR
jgi:D-arabinose 1-dehydrogenase-like Zn-dependent alcohol dehydrogenase